MHLKGILRYSPLEKGQSFLGFFFSGVGSKGSNWPFHTEEHQFRKKRDIWQGIRQKCEMANFTYRATERLSSWQEFSCNAIAVIPGVSLQQDGRKMCCMHEGAPPPQRKPVTLNWNTAVTLLYFSISLNGTFYHLTRRIYIYIYIYPELFIL